LAFSIDPGWVETELGRDGKGEFAKAIESLVAKTPEEGAYSTVFCTCDPILTVQQSGEFYTGINEIGSLREYAKSSADALVLWDWTLVQLQNYLNELK